MSITARGEKGRGLAGGTQNDNQQGLQQKQEYGRQVQPYMPKKSKEADGAEWVEKSIIPAKPLLWTTRLSAQRLGSPSHRLNNEEDENQDEEQQWLTAWEWKSNVTRGH